ncbi:MAG TPA: hypothetical protein VFU20_05645 [Sphingomicrobium sp.]|nr:hypothetical protein [Sphingomicrobium sp.]
MIAGHWLLGLAPLLAASGAIAQQPAPAGAPPARETSAAEAAAAQKIAACEGEKFEFTAGDQRPTRITLCSDKGASKDDLVRMFESAADKIRQIDKLPADRKAALVAQLEAKIIEVRSDNVLAIPLPAPRPVPEIGPKPEYAQLPPMPPPVRTPVVAQSSLGPAVALSKPRLTLQCSTPGEIGEGGPCLNLAKDTVLTVRAGETLPAGTSLRFVRRGDVRGEFALAQMRKGQARRIRLPLDVCSGVVSSEVEIQVLRRATATGLGQVVDTRGPYQLRC